MGNKARFRKRAEKEERDLDKPFTTTRRAYLQLATQEANKMFQEQQHELIKDINDTLQHGIIKTISVIVASSLEEVYGFKAHRNGRVISKIMKHLEDMYDPLTKCDIKDHVKYWEDKKLYIEEDGKSTIIRVGNKEVPKDERS